MLSDEERKAINEYNKSVGIVLNLINKQSKEIEELKEDSCCMTNCVRRDKEKLFLEDKIKAKIEEVSNGTFDAKIVLQSLLEKE